MNRLQDKYNKEVIKVLQTKFNFQSSMQVPRIQKVVINCGVGEATQNPKIINSVQEEITVIAGQKAVVCLAKKAISNFKLRQGLSIGVRVTLRREKM